MDRAFVPWGSHFKSTGVALGTLALYGLVLVIGTAALAGSVGRGLVPDPLRLGAGVLFDPAPRAMSGSDGATLRWVYVLSAVVVVLQFTRWLDGTLARGPELLVE